MTFMIVPYPLIGWLKCKILIKIDDTCADQNHFRFQTSKWLGHINPWNEFISWGYLLEKYIFSEEPLWCNRYWANIVIADGLLM